MHISNITASNLKGRHIKTDAGPLTLIIGPNYSGKTAIVEAVRLTLLGHIPEIGKRNSETMETLCSGTRMTTGLTITKEGPEVELRREFWLERGSVKSETNVEADEWNTPLLDSGAYFAMTDTQRIDYVFSKVTLPEQFTATGIMSRLHRLSFGAEHSEAVEAAKADVLALCRKAFDSEDKDGVPITLQDYLTSLTGVTLKEEFTNWNRRAKDSEGAVRVLTELKLRETECSAVTLTDLRNEASRLEGLLAEASREAGALRERSEAAIRVARRRNELTTLLAAPEPAWPSPMVAGVHGETVEELQEQLDDVNSQIEALPDPNSGLEEAYNKAMRDLKSVEDRLQAASGRFDAAAEAFYNFDNLQCCPTCQAKGKGWKAGVLVTLKEARETAKLEVNKLGEEADAAAAMESAARSAAHQQRATKGQLDELNTKAVRLGRAIDTKKLELANHQAAVTAANTKQQRARDQWAADRAAQQAELERMQETPAPTDSELSAAVNATNLLTAQRGTALEAIRAAERLQHDLRRASEAAAEHEIARAKADVIKAVGKALKDSKGEMVAEAFAGLLATANSITGDLLPSPLAYDPESGDIGRYGTSGFINHKGFSGTEKALAYCAIAAALAARAQFRLLILDEMGRLTPALQGRVMAAFEGAVERGLLDQVLCVIPMDAEDVARAMDTPAAGWTVIATA